MKTHYARLPANAPVERPN